MAYTDGLKIGYAGIMVSITKQYEIWGLPIWDLTPPKSVNFMAMALMILEGFGHFDDGTCILNESLSQKKKHTSDSSSDFSGPSR